MNQYYNHKHSYTLINISIHITRIIGSIITFINSQFDPESFQLPLAASCRSQLPQPQEELPSQATDPPTLALEPVEPEPDARVARAPSAVTPVVSPKGAMVDPGEVPQGQVMAGPRMRW